MTYDVRRIRPDEWRRIRELRLEMLQDPAAPIAFLDTYDAAVARPEEFWRQRAAASSAGETSVNYVALAGERWVGSVSGLLELPGSDDFEGRPITTPQVHVVGVYVDPAHRGAGLFERMLTEVDGWAQSLGVERLRLYVHEENARARAAYVRCGFVLSGITLDAPSGTELEMTRAIGDGSRTQ